jgi:hypothetical protein
VGRFAVKYFGNRSQTGFKEMSFESSDYFLGSRSSPLSFKADQGANERTQHPGPYRSLMV